ncbi:MAG: hypothetical protein QW451_00545 [Candidatus Aenigmatarchaeota archaeon]
MKLDKNLTKRLYEIKDFVDRALYTTKETFKDKRVQKWTVCGIVTYGLPAFYRAITRNPDLPYIPLIVSQNEYIPVNLPEKLIVNPIAPGGVGAVIGETFIKKFKATERIEKYVSRVIGSVATTTIWTSIQYCGHVLCDMLKIQWPSGGNPFEPPNVYPFNLLIALTLAPLIPYVVDYLKLKMKRNSDEV